MRWFYLHTQHDAQSILHFSAKSQDVALLCSQGKTVPFYLRGQKTPTFDGANFHFCQITHIETFIKAAKKAHTLNMFAAQAPTSLLHSHKLTQIRRSDE